MTELPPANTRRWVARRKAAVVAAVSSGMLTIEEACRRYQISEKEFSAWQRAFERGMALSVCAPVTLSNTVALVPKRRRPRNEAPRHRGVGASSFS